MGGGGTLVEWIRRFFNRQQRSSSSSSSATTTTNSRSDEYVSNKNNNAILVKDLRSQLASIPNHDTDLTPEEDSDHSALKHIKGAPEAEFFTEYGEASQYEILEVVGKGSYGVVGSAVDIHTGEKVAIKKINDVFEHVSDATRILREIKLLRLLRHPDIVEIKHIMLPPSRREFRDIYVVFELMESDLHQVIKANDDLTPEHHQFFLYQLLRGLKYIHTANVFHRDLKPKNILVNADCKLKICDFGLARVSFNDAPSAIFWTDYVATRWYRAPELCGSFFSKYTPAVDIWSIGCIFAEMLIGKPLFRGKNVVHQLDLMTDLLGTPPAESIARIRNEKAKRYLSNMRKKQPVPLSQKFPKADPLALSLLERLLAFNPKDRPTAEEALADPYFNGLSNIDCEPSTQPISKLEFEFERRRLTKDDVRELIYREILEYHPQMLQEYLNGGDLTSFMYPSGVDLFKRQFAHLEEHYGKGQRSSPLQRQHASLPRERVVSSKVENNQNNCEKPSGSNLQSSPESDVTDSGNAQNGSSKTNNSTHSLLKSSSISGSKCIDVKQSKDSKTAPITEVNEAVHELTKNLASLHA
ncbi:PREDICTED: mitogen-activated protein kinase 9-like isoform X2 [Lupinus angustifolius]|uniref:mitogen-activated protein kinase 9-like isoform X2 n=1 Tax=Lupinus angustifolius TaxID=3871 RepID=UPI00092EE725|nr:PREDICTED: mitogen-activated protein kinase 9-like isoform X2 [Lupinus angustifolius]